MKLKNAKVVRFSNSHSIYVLEKRENVFVQELVLENSEVSFDSASSDAFCIIYFNQIFSRSQKMKSLIDYFQASVFKNVGKLSSKYSSHYQVDYNPSTYKIVRTLLNNPSYPMKLSRSTFQRTYYELVRFSQKEEN